MSTTTHPTVTDHHHVDDATDPGYVLHERADGGWWIMRNPDDTAGDVAGYVDGYVECLVAGAWRAVSWDRETVVHGATLHSAADQLVAQRWDPAPDTTDDAARPADAVLGAPPGRLAHFMSADLTPWCGAGPDGTGSTLCTPVAEAVTCAACRRLLDSYPDETADPDSAHLLGIVLALAEQDPVTYDDHGRAVVCTLCEANPRGATWTMPEEHHQATCPWRLARTYSTDLAAAHRS